MIVINRRKKNNTDKLYILMQNFVTSFIINKFVHVELEFALGRTYQLKLQTPNFTYHQSPNSHAKFWNLIYNK